MADLQVRRWRRFGQDRLYVHLGNGSPVGCLDLRTGRTTLDRRDLQDEFEVAIAAAARARTAPRRPAVTRWVLPTDDAVPLASGASPARAGPLGTYPEWRCDMNARQRSGSMRVSEWVLSVLGAIAAFLGLFILFAGDDQYVGLGGEASWRVGDISAAWGVGLLLVGIVLAGLVAVLVQQDRHRVGATGARPEPSSQADVLVHATVFVLVNAFLWIQDIAIGDGLNYAYWVTIPWGIGLAVHAFSAFASEPRHPAPH